MNGNITQKKKGISRQTILLIVFVFIVLGGGVYYYITTLAPQEPESIVELGTKQQLQIKRVDWKKTVYEHKTLRALRNPLSEPLEVGTVGNPNPFRQRMLIQPGQ